MEYEYSNVIKKVSLGWLDFFEKHKEELISILNKVNQDIEKGRKVYPKPDVILRAFKYFDPQETKLVLLGQDPYISSEYVNGIEVPQACGLSFSVPKSHRRRPPSLYNMFKEIKSCYPDSQFPKHGSLKRWAKKEHILLLNSALTVIQGESNSHSTYWKPFTDKLIEYISSKTEHTSFLLMGNYAISKNKFIDIKKHKVFTAVHPSPLSAKHGFFGCKVFKDINDYYESIGVEPIKWLR